MKEIVELQKGEKIESSVAYEIFVENNKKKSQREKKKEKNKNKEIKKENLANDHAGVEVFRKKKKLTEVFH